MEKESALIELYKDIKFHDSLGLVRNNIEKEMNAFLKWLKERLKEEQRIFDNIESRIKSLDSFTEKIRRKNYIDQWIVKGVKIHDQDMICKNLPDLIGFRINCFFMKDEEIIYTLLKKYYDEKKFDTTIVLNFEEDTKQQNGHIIYKLTGVYNGTHNFEVQIKSLFHNVWGEVEHKTIYKGRHFDPNIESRKVITEEIFKVLDASDKQLLEMYKASQQERQLIQTLFYYQTHCSIKDKFKTDILSKHYQHFFEIFKQDDDFNKINNYVANKMLNVEIEKNNYTKFEIDEKVEHLSSEISRIFQKYELEFIYEIASILYNFDDYNDFLNYFSNYLLSIIVSTDEMRDDTFDNIDDSFSEEDEYKYTTQDKPKENVDNAVKYLSVILEKRR